MNKILKRFSKYTFKLIETMKLNCSLKAPFSNKIFIQTHLKLPWKYLKLTWKRSEAVKKSSKHFET